jgi:NADH-quinone oxidoreductase subunit G
MKRAVDDKEIGSKIKTVMTRCIHCTRCVRFATEIAGVEEFGATGRGENMQVGTYVEHALQSELAGNMIDLCPVGALTSKPYAYTARPWELKRMPSVDVLDAIGAPVWVDTRADKVMRVVPQDHPAINEEWLTDAARYSYDALANNRLVTPLIKGKPASWPEAFAALKKAFGKAEGKIGAILGDMQSAETGYSLTQFMQGQGGTVAALPNGREVGLPNTLGAPLTAFETADAVVLVGCNPRREAPLLNIRLRRGATKRNMLVLNVGAAADLTYAHTHVGDKAEALADCAKLLKGKTNVHVLVGAQALNRSDAATLIAEAAKLGALHVLESSCGYVTNQAVGAAQTATAKVLKDYMSGKTNLLLVHGEGSMDASDIKGAKGTLVYVGTHTTRLSAEADICLPSAAWAEEAGMFMNAEARVQETKAATQPPLQAKESWKIYRALSEELGQALPWNSQAQLREALVKTVPQFAENLREMAQAQAHKVVKPEGKLLAKAFTEAVENYYLRTPYLQQSAWMNTMQAEAGTAKIGKAA